LQASLRAWPPFLQLHAIGDESPSMLPTVKLFFDLVSVTLKRIPKLFNLAES